MIVKLFTCDRIFFEGDCAFIAVPGVEGDFGVLPNHEDFISTMREGEIILDTDLEQEKKFLVKGGVARVGSNVVEVFSENFDCL